MIHITSWSSKALLSLFSMAFYLCLLDLSFSYSRVYLKPQHCVLPQHFFLLSWFPVWLNPTNFLCFPLSPQTQTTPCCATLVTTRSWLSRRSLRVPAGRAGGIPPGAHAARAAIPAAPAFPSALPCCLLLSDLTSRQSLCLYVHKIILLTFQQKVLFKLC